MSINIIIITVQQFIKVTLLHINEGTMLYDHLNQSRHGSSTIDTSRDSLALVIAPPPSPLQINYATGDMRFECGCSVEYRCI